MIELVVEEHTYKTKRNYISALADNAKQDFTICHADRIILFLTLYMKNINLCKFPLDYIKIITIKIYYACT